MDIVLITRDRPELTKQTIESMVKNSEDFSRHRLLVVFDGTGEEREARLPHGVPPVYRDCVVTGKQLGVGGAKNFGAGYFGMSPFDPAYNRKHDLLMFTDNDMYYLSGWDEQLERTLISEPDITQLGGWRHPFHRPRPFRNVPGVSEVDAATGNCFVIRWSDWFKYGPFDSNAIGPGQSEDFALSQKIKAGGGIVATLDPPIAIHCGICNSEGKVATGWEEMLIMALGQMREHNCPDVLLWVPQTVRRPDEPKPKAPQLGLNVGSGQRRFNSVYGVIDWVNIDCISRPPDQVPDMILDAAKDKLPAGADYVVLHHVLEHFGCGEADALVRNCWDALKPGGSLLTFVPDLRKLAGRWLNGEIDDYTFMVNTYGAYQGEEGDRHKWGYSAGTLATYLHQLVGDESEIRVWRPRDIPGASIAEDWWIVGIEFVKQ